ncbi:Na+-translocating ferredoxin:NAD+ oxidoreductase RnfG subunit [Actimicrobium sp. GrIS 1.19]|uniref:hypothetical protein n=1 Tax=Actimicrobium sp. GrIS 1.19 TaxID=3071708 RepID=UPI002E0C4B20|nr:Na+-translocating ferredoxin:NAD+ oxidoreductase RnfG subunit [Actimicrobium sp. GrIS 1.19]
MNIHRILIVAAFAAVSGAAVAGEVNPFAAEQQEAARKLRTEVKSDVLSARARGELPDRIETTWPSLRDDAPVRTRAEVKAETIQAAMHHRFDAAHDLN